MGNILKKMRDKMPYRFLSFNIFLSASMAKPALYYVAAIKTVFFPSFFKMAHEQ